MEKTEKTIESLKYEHTDSILELINYLSENIEEKYKKDKITDILNVSVRCFRELYALAEEGDKLRKSLIL